MDEGGTDIVPEPRGSSTDNLSVTLSERFIATDRGPVPIMQNPRLTKMVGRQDKITLDKPQIALRYAILFDLRQLLLPRNGIQSRDFNVNTVQLNIASVISSDSLDLGAL